jgi:hypothetical protein
MLLQAAIGACLEALEDFCIGPLYAYVALWVSNRRIADLDAKVLIVPLERAAGELGTIVSDNSIWESKPIDDGLDELDCRLLIDLDHWGRFRPLGEFVDGDIEIPIVSDGPGEWSQDVPPHTQRMAMRMGSFVVSTLVCRFAWHETDMPYKSLPARWRPG